MELQAIFAILGVALSFVIAAAGVGRYLAQNRRRLDLLQDEIKMLREQSQTLRTAVSLPSARASTDIFTQLMELSTEAAKSVGAEIHSISVPVPSGDPTDLRIILSSDPQAAKVVGREFPITMGIAGWVFKNQTPYFRNRANADPRHFNLVDKAAGTQSGEGAMLTAPLSSGGRCYGVIQFMKSKGGEFAEEHVAIATRWCPQLTRLLMELEQSPQEDIPSIARGNVITTSILFSDISDFTAIAEKIRLDTSVALLNEYYSRLLPIVLRRGGELREYVGDGLFVKFSLSTPATSARAAITSALEMQEEYQQILESWIQYAHPVSTSNTHNIGIATGFVYSGLVGHSRKRQEKLIGTPVNLAAHLCEIAEEEKGGIVICDRTAEIIRLDDFKLEPISSSGERYYRIVPGYTKASI
jgi:class 3 adenylate cyclase